MIKKCCNNAIILASGFGMRMVPINTEVPKGLLVVRGEVLIERLIRQLRDAKVEKIYIVVGFMKESFEYLVDEFDVELIENPEYSVKNNLHSLSLVRDKISDTYILPCDIWCEENPFIGDEFHSWYMVTDKIEEEKEVIVGENGTLIRNTPKSVGNEMIGISHLCGKEAEIVKSRIEELSTNPDYDDSFWEEVLYKQHGDKEYMIVPAKVVDSKKFFEINSFEQLREIDSNSEHLQSKVISIISSQLSVEPHMITDIKALKKGMTNRSFLFNCGNKKYIMRIPGEGTEQLINRKEEAAVYNKIKDINISDKVIYINPRNGYKITEYIEDSRVCDAFNDSDVAKCMKKLKWFHKQSLVVEHKFDFFQNIDFYESLWGEYNSIYEDYEKTKANVLSLKNFISDNTETEVLTHIDAVPDNFLIYTDNSGAEQIKLIDWEYSGMQDPHVDIAMFAIYALYDKKHIDKLIDFYFENNCPKNTRIKIYCYISVCGLLWSNWCEYKRNLGVEFGEYSIKQYRYAKDYYRIAVKEIEGINKCIQ